MDLLPTYAITVLTIFILFLWHIDRKNNLEQIKDLLEKQQLERKDLYDRIMASNFVEYKQESIAEEEPTTKEEEVLVDIDDARDEIMGEDTKEEEVTNG